MERGGAYFTEVTFRGIEIQSAQWMIRSGYRLTLIPGDPKCDCDVTHVGLIPYSMTDPFGLARVCKVVGMVRSI